MSEKILELKNVHTSFYTPAGEVKAVRGLSLDLYPGEVLGIVGESGSGKSVTMLSLMRLLGRAGKVKEGSIKLKGQELTILSDREVAKKRGREMAMIFQDPMTSLNPVLTVGYQLTEGLWRHGICSKSEAKKRAIEMLHLVGIEPAETRINQYPHEFSGGQRQRIMIACALMCQPDVLIADEPTTALDVTVQAQILELMKSLQERLNTSIILITHDLGVVAGMASRVVVMYGGQVMEQGPRREVYYRRAHPYTKGLFQSVPDPEKLTKERLIPIEGTPPDLLHPPVGCPYAPRCPEARKICLLAQPPLFALGDDHFSACWLHQDCALGVKE